MRGAWALIALVAGCYADNALQCGDRLCPSTYVCTENLVCASPLQREVCEGKPEQTLCTYGDNDGVCRAEVCTIYRCGDGVQDPGEQCDDGNTVSGDGCSGDCRGRFDLMQPPVAWSLSGVAMIAPDNAYAVGNESLLHYDGAAWTAIPVPGGTLLDVSVTGSTLFAGGIGNGDPSGRLLRMDAGTQPVIVPSSVETILSVWAVSPTDVYVATSSELYHYGGTWAPITLCVTGRYMMDVIGVGTEVFVATSGGICRGSFGKTWQLLDSAPAQALAATDETLYALDNSTIRKYSIRAGLGEDGVLAVPGALKQIAVVDDGVILGVGGGGVVLEYRPSTQTWTRLATPTTVQLDGIAASSPTDAFIVGDHGTILH